MYMQTDECRLSMRVVARAVWLALAVAMPIEKPVQAESNSAPMAAKEWFNRLLAVPYAPPAPASPAVALPTLELVRQDYESLERSRSVIQTPLIIGERKFTRGLGTHSVGQLRVRSAEPLKQFVATIGVDHNERTRGGQGSVIFRIVADGVEKFRSRVFRGGQAAEDVDLRLDGAHTLELFVDDAGDGPACDHADWAHARIVTDNDAVHYLDALAHRATGPVACYPFSFYYGDCHANELLAHWQKESRTEPLSDGRQRSVTVWTDPRTQLRLEWQVVRFADFPAVEWLIYFENGGSADSEIIRDVDVLDLVLDGVELGQPFQLHRTNGAPSNPTDFEPRLVPLNSGTVEQLGGGGGRSSNRDFPFFKIETPRAAWIAAIGWSGQWQAQLAATGGRLRTTAGLERTHFRLRPKERVRMPRILLMHWPAAGYEANAQFRQLIYRHFAARRAGKPPMPLLFCNTCFTRGGGWLNECNAENQISLIRAYAPMKLDAVITDAGWFEGGWPNGVGNWTPRKDAYPNGMAPVADAARKNGTVYGLWFEFERVAAGSRLQRERPDWLLRAGAGNQNTFLLDLGNPAVRDHIFNIVKGFMDLPGFRVYRSDFNMDPLAYWRFTDAPDRQGIAEMKYVEGLYELWDRFARAWPDALLEECASGGRRIDLETIMRMHLHQKSDFWFNNEVDQGSIWGLSQYLPNHVFVTPLARLDERSFQATLASSLCLGWIADAPEFDRARALRLVQEYRELAPYLIGGWYPLLPYSRDGRSWMAAQYHLPELNAGLVLVTAPLQSNQRTIALALHALDPAATYELHYRLADKKVRATGAELRKHLPVTIVHEAGVERIMYRRVR
jgi:alpha-galactosidase